MATLSLGKPLPSPACDAPLVAMDGSAATLREICKGHTTLVLFVRQFACAGCSEQVTALLPSLPALRVMSVDVVIIGCGTREHAQWFDERLGVVARGVRIFTDATLTVQREVGLSRTWAGVFGPRGTIGLLRAMLNGHKNGWSGGDFYQQGGALLLDAKLEVLFYEAQQWLGDLVDIGDITDVVLASRAREKSRSDAARDEVPA